VPESARVRSRLVGTRRKLLCIGLAATLAAAVFSTLALDAPSASADAPLSIAASPALTPAFSPSVSDYTARCGTSLSVATTVTVSVLAPAGTMVAVDGTTPQSGLFSVDVSRAWGQSFPISVVVGGAAPVTYYVRCTPTDMPPITAIRSGTPQAEYYLLSAIGSVDFSSAGSFSAHYLEVVDTHGVPVWWYDTGSPVGDTKVLANGNLAWLPGSDTLGVGGGDAGLTERRFDGSLVTRVQLRDNPPADLHDFEPLPNGDWLMESYAKVAGVNLSSIGGASNTCILDAEVEEVTPTGEKVWSWFASQHLSPTEINPDARPTVATSNCVLPQDTWHLNSLQPLGSSFLVSLRYTNAVYRINIATGAVMWKVGGSKTAQSLRLVGDPSNGFVGQHDARMWPDGSVSVFDNGGDGFTSFQDLRRSRMARYRINTVARTATMEQQILDPYITNSSLCCGSARLLPGGDWAIGYGLQGINTEVTASGKRVLSLNFNDPSTDPAHPAPTLFSYRMTPVLPATLSRATLRADMDAMHPVGDDQPPTVVSNGLDNACSRPGDNGWCRGTQTAGFDAFDNAAGLPVSLCGGSAPSSACRFSVTSNTDGSAVMIPAGQVCDVASSPNCTDPATPAEAGPFSIDSTPPQVLASATTANGSPYTPGTPTTQAVTVHFTCSDATSGVASCPRDVTVTNTDSGPRVVSGSATDNAGNAAVATLQVGFPVVGPGPVRSVSARPSGAGAAKVTWKAPTRDGGSPITGYVVTPFLGSDAQRPRIYKSTATTELITGLQHGKTYRFAVAARNAVRTGVASPKTNPIVVGASG
jgi:hypothetical protein